MILSKTSPVAEDAWIHRLLTTMERLLPNQWGASTGEVLFYGRSYQIDNKDVWYSGEKYIDIFANKAYKFISFIRISNNSSFNLGKHVTPAKLICQGNTKLLYPSVTHRADAELREACYDALFIHCHKDQYLGHTVINEDNIKDMHPYHTFELNFNIVY